MAGAGETPRRQTCARGLASGRGLRHSRDPLAQTCSASYHLEEESVRNVPVSSRYRPPRLCLSTEGSVTA